MHLPLYSFNKYKDDPVTNCNYVEGSKLSVSIKRTYANKYYIL